MRREQQYSTQRSAKRTHIKKPTGNQPTLKHKISYMCVYSYVYRHICIYTHIDIYICVCVCLTKILCTCNSTTISPIFSWYLHTYYHSPGSAPEAAFLSRILQHSHFSLSLSLSRSHSLSLSHAAQILVANATWKKAYGCGTLCPDIDGCSQELVSVGSSPWLEEKCEPKGEEVRKLEDV